MEPIDWTSTPRAFDDDPLPKPKIMKYCLSCQKDISASGYRAHIKTQRHFDQLELMIYRNKIESDNSLIELI